MRMRAVACMALVLLALPCVAAEQSELLRRNVQFEQLSTEDGLSHEMVYDIEQDADGFVWLATLDGLSRFDGYDVVRHNHLRTDPATLSSDFVRTLLRDSRDRLWVGTEAGVDLWLGTEAGFDRAPFADLVPEEVLANSVRAIVEGPGGVLWFGTADGGLVMVDEAGGSYRVTGAASTPELDTNTILSLAFTSDGALWVGTEGSGVLRRDPESGRIERPAGLDDIAGSSVRALTEDRNGRLWIGTDALGARSVDLATGAVRAFRHDAERSGTLPSDRVRAIHEDPFGSLWFATDGGLAEWRDAASAFVSYVHRDGDGRTLASDRVNMLFSDAGGVLWAGTWNGSSRWNRVSDVFSYYLAADGNLPGDFIASLAEGADGVIWVGTYGDGLGRLDPRTGEARFYRSDADDPTSLPDDRVMSLHVDSAGRVWVGTRAAGLAWLDEASGVFTRFQHDPEDPASISGDAVTSVLQDSRGDLWVGTFGAGLNRLAGAEGDRFERFTADPADPEAIAGDRVLMLEEAPDGTLWIGMEGTGLDRRPADAEHFEHISQLELIGTDGTPLQIDSVTDLLFASDGELWIGTLSQGLLRWPEADRTADRPRGRIYDKARGMPADAVYGLLEAEDGALWVSSDRGLTRLDPTTGSTRLFDARAGLRDSEFNAFAHLGARSGHMLFGGPEGLVRFQPGELPFNALPPRIVLSASSRDERLVTVSAGADAVSVEVGYLDPFLAFDFVALDFVSPDKNQYRYRLAGFDPDWVDAAGFRRAMYTNLPAGRYTFEVEASNNDGVWSEVPARIDVIAVPAPWNSLWAYALYVLIALSVAGLYLRAQREKLARESRQRVLLEEQVEQRTRELAQSNRDLHRLNERLEEAAVTDSLTSLRNRRYADQFLANDISKFEREQLRQLEEPREPPPDPQQRSMFLMMIDLDGFKAINDHFGHHAGDRALLQVRDLLLQTCRASDTIIRWGGDEFLISGTTADYADVKILAERIRDAIASHRFEVGSGRDATLSASIGIAPYPLVPDRYSFCSWELVSAVADQAAYIAKSSGRDAWVSLVGTDTLSPEVLTGLGQRIGDLIDSGQLALETNLTGELRAATGARIGNSP